MLHYLPERWNYLIDATSTNVFKRGVLIYKYDKSYFKIEAEKIRLDSFNHFLWHKGNFKFYPRQSNKDSKEKADYFAFKFSKDWFVLGLKNFKRIKIKEEEIDRTAKSLLDLNNIIFINDSLGWEFKVKNKEDFKILHSFSSKNQLDYLPHQRSSKTLSISLGSFKDIKPYYRALEKLLLSNYHEINLKIILNEVEEITSYLSLLEFPISTFTIQFCSISSPISEFFPNLDIGIFMNALLKSKVTLLKLYFKKW